MRKARGYNLFLSVVGIFILCAALFAYHMPSLPKGGEYTLYMGTSSSAQRVPTDAPWRDCLLLPVKGESVCLSGNRYEEMKERYCAVLQFKEEVNGIVNYYLYSPYLGETVLLDGYRVNLHVAQTDEKTAVGTPLIFGGY